ncbi:MAG: hypothetical protein KGI29_08605 [Pseudomonadota bacterium]|nr:hypothetical protein [Pseudomonadota bacterium]MDE3037814.1 hypothetical protein [Pseudomonadota bacterium]
MATAINAAISGLAAANTRLTVSASNVANQSSTSWIVNGQTVNQSYAPQKVDQASLQSGGVQARVSKANPAGVTVQGMQSSNVDTASQMVQQSIAAYDFKANLKTIKVQDQMQKSLLDIIS